MSAEKWDMVLIAAQWFIVWAMTMATIAAVVLERPLVAVLIVVHFFFFGFASIPLNIGYPKSPRERLAEWLEEKFGEEEL